MRKISLFVLLILVGIGANVKGQYLMRIHNDSHLIYQQQVDKIDSLKFANEHSSLYPNTGMFELPIASIDSITFSSEVDSLIYIIYNGSQATVINPFADEGVNITDNAGHLTVISTHPTAGLKYHILGTTTDGSFTFTSDQAVKLILSQASITNPKGAAILLNSATTVAELFLSAGTVNTLNDASKASGSGTLHSKADLTITGAGALNVNGYKKHGISVDGTLTIESGIINIAQAASDGIHVNDYVQNGGTITMLPTSDGIDVSNTIEINGGDLTVIASSNDVKGIKATGDIAIHDGTIAVNVSGNQSKAINSKASLIINGGTIDLAVSGATVLEAAGSGFDPSYATGIKTKKDITVNGGVITVDLPTSNNGGKGFSADGDIVINDGTITINTSGAGATYTNESGGADSYTSACIKADGNVQILAGTITLKSSGIGGKGVNVDGTLTIGVLAADDNDLNLSVTTTGERFFVSGSGQNADYANPKAIKSLGDLTVNSGIITLNCTQTEKGGEGLESKANLYVKGGQITAITYDDCINASTHIEISGGKHSLTANGNDGVDSNGTFTISGGLVISKGTGGPECGFDCDNSTFKVLGGTMVGTGGNTSNPTVSVSTQNSLKLSINSDQNICIKNASNQVILMHALPTLSGAGGPDGPGGPRDPGGPGGSNKMIVLFSDPAFVNGTYTIYYGGAISGGTNFNGYYTGATYSGGSSSTFTINSKYTTVNL